ncbi:MAG: glycosyltransferase family 39 protein [Bacteroidota bacterium]
MKENSLLYKIVHFRYNFVALLLIALGIIFRLVMFYQNRDLIIDEANVVRNIYERNFFGLLKPLSYEQYAPPIYLWALEINSFIFGYSEQAMRLVALLCGIGSLFLFWSLLTKVLPKNSLWLPLGLLCFAPILVRYSAEVKQYVPDAFVAIALVFAALKIDLASSSRRKFVLSWICIGSIAIWASQPSVFILASVGFYYFIQVVQQKRWDDLKALSLIALVWFAQFGLYYELILKTQINSAYLQNYHREYFLFPSPATDAEWEHNWERLKEILHNTAGYNQYSHYACIFLILIGSLSLLEKSLKLFALLAFPIVFTLIAAAASQFSLIERVVIFILPFTMILMGYGFSLIMGIGFKSVQLIVFLFGAYVLNEYNLKSLFSEKFNFQELTTGMDYIKSKGGQGKELYVDCASVDTYIYYTEIHPKKDRYSMLKGAYLFDWSDDNYKEVAQKVSTPRSFFIFTGGGSDLRNRHTDEVKQFLTQTDYYENFCYVFTFKK